MWSQVLQVLSANARGPTSPMRIDWSVTRIIQLDKSRDYRKADDLARCEDGDPVKVNERRISAMDLIAYALTWI